MLWVAVGILSGYILASVWPNVPVKLLVIFALVFSMASVVIAVRAPLFGLQMGRRLVWWGSCFLLAGTCLAWAWHEVRVQRPSEDWATLPPREATLTLRIMRNFTPRPGSDSVGGLAKVVEAPEVLHELQDQNIEFYVRLNFQDDPPARGSTVEVLGLLNYLPTSPPVANDEKAADSVRFRNFLHAQGAWFELSRARILRVVAPPDAWTRWLTSQHARVEAILKNGPDVLENKYSGIYEAFLLGEPSRLDEKRGAFTVSGEIYLFAISGLHVGVLAATLWWLLRKIPGVPHAVGEVFTLGVVWLYIEIAGGSPSARRAGLMLTLYLLAKWVARARSPLAAVIVAGVATLIIDPLALNNSGFQLSYGVVLGLILYASLLRAAIESRWRPWRDVPPASLAPWKKCVVWLWNRLFDVLTTSWTALLCSASLTAEFFGVFSVYNLLLGAVFFPLACSTLGSGAIAFVAGIVGFPPFTWLAWLANALGLLTVGLMYAIAAVFLPLPGFFTYLQIIPPVAGSFATLAILAAMLLAQPRNRLPRWWYFALPVLILALFALFTARPL